MMRSETVGNVGRSETITKPRSNFFFKNERNNEDIAKRSNFEILI